MKPKRWIDVIDYQTGGVVRSVEVTGKSDGMIEKIERGLLRQMDTEKFYTIERTKERR